MSFVWWGPLPKLEDLDRGQNVWMCARDDSGLTERRVLYYDASRKKRKP